MSTQKQSPLTLFVATGLMLFALFFGAGNLIFPAHMGQQAGESYFQAVLGFVLTGAGLPMLGILAMTFTGARDIQQLAARVTPWFGVCFAVALYLSIGPLFALPRTGTVAFEVGVKPFLSEGVSDSLLLLVFSVAFFAFAYFLAMSPGKLINRIGKILTPTLLLAIAILAIKTIADPMGGLTEPQANFQSHPLVEGFLAGYQTMDALAALVFAIIVIASLQSAGVSNNQQLMRMTMGAGVLAAFCLAVVYGLVTYMGAGSVEVLGWLDNGALVLSGIASHYWGTLGQLLLMIIIFLACLTTAVGLIAACAEYFARLLPRISYQGYALIFTLISCVLANKGLSGIISFSIPVLMLLYPLTVVLILLVFSHSIFKGYHAVYLCTMGLTFVVGLLDGWKAALGLPDVVNAFLTNYLPWYNMGLGWIAPALIGFVLGLILVACGAKKKVA